VLADDRRRPDHTYATRCLPAHPAVRPSVDVDLDSRGTHTIQRAGHIKSTGRPRRRLKPATYSPESTAAGAARRRDNFWPTCMRCHAVCTMRISGNFLPQPHVGVGNVSTHVCLFVYTSQSVYFEQHNSIQRDWIIMNFVDVLRSNHESER